MAWRTNLKMEPRTLDQLLLLCNDDQAIYVNSEEDNLEERVRKLEDLGYMGSVYYAETRNMRWAENRLLEARVDGYEHSKQSKSSAEEKPGCVYLIIGKRCRRGSLELERVDTQAELHGLCHEDGSIYVGSTVEERREDRMREHEDNGFSGTFYYVETRNMRDAEDALFAECDFDYLYNAQGQSNRSDHEPGYVYLINGWRNASRRGILRTVRKPTKDELYTLCLEEGSIYVGSMRTEQRDDRVEAYMESGFSGIFYYANIGNMRKAENEILQKRPGGYQWNMQTESNRKEERGCVFLIKGERHE